MSNIFFPPILLMTHLMSNMVRINLNSLFFSPSQEETTFKIIVPHKTYLWKGYTEDHLFAISASQPLSLFFQVQGVGQGERCCLQWTQVPWRAEPTAWSQPGSKFKENFFTTRLPTSSQSSLPPQSRLGTYSLNLWYGWKALVLTCT